jgi:hypothetical protein
MQKMIEDGLVDRIVFGFCVCGRVCVVYCKLFKPNVLWCALALRKSKTTSVMNYICYFSSVLEMASSTKAREDGLSEE